MLSRFHLILECYGRTDRQTDRFAISVSHVTMLTRDKKSKNGSSLNYNPVTNSAATLRMEIQHVARLGLR